jgi:TPP-dependent pyruvate/acetoin dehydrogenase alpha subunit
VVTKARDREARALPRRQGAAAGTPAAQIQRLGLSEDDLHRILYHLKLCRYFDERMETLYRQGKLPGAIYSGRGQEGTHVGVAFALRPED